MEANVTHLEVRFCDSNQGWNSLSSSITLLFKFLKGAFRSRFFGAKGPDISSGLTISAVRKCPPVSSCLDLNKMRPGTQMQYSVVTA